MTNPTTDRKPVTITEAEEAARGAALAVREAKAELSGAEAAYAGAADADADAVAHPSYKPSAPLPSVRLKERLDTAAARLSARETLHRRAQERLEETFRAADDWRAAEQAAADQAEAEALTKLDELIASFDRAKQAQALAAWAATSRTGAPQPFSRMNGVTGPEGEKLLRDLVERHLGITQRRYVAANREAVRKAAESAAASAAAAVAAVEQRQARYDAQQAAEERNRQRYLDSLAEKVG